MMSQDTITREFGDSETGLIIKDQKVRIDLKTITRNVFFVRQQDNGLIVGSIIKRVKGFIPVWWDSEAVRWRAGGKLPNGEIARIGSYRKSHRKTPEAARQNRPMAVQAVGPFPSNLAKESR